MTIRAPVACAVALEVLRVYEDERILDHVRELAPTFQARLRAFAGRPWVGHVRGVGLIGAIELMADKAARTPFTLLAAICSPLPEPPITIPSEPGWATTASPTAMQNGG